MNFFELIPTSIVQPLTYSVCLTFSSIVKYIYFSCFDSEQEI